MKSYNRIFMGELLMYVLAANTLGYLGVAIPTGNLNLRFINYTMLGPGMVLSLANFYGRYAHNG